MNLTQLEQIKTDLKQEIYEQNKIKKDLVVINYRFGGLAEEIPETH
jgi:hypothetical protein